MAKTLHVPKAALNRLARSYGIQTAYADLNKNMRHASPEALMAALRALRCPIDDPGQAGDALRARQVEVARRMISPVLVAWNGRPTGLDICLPRSISTGRFECTLKLERGANLAGAATTRRAKGAEFAPGTTHRWSGVVGRLDLKLEFEVRGERFIKRAIPIPGPLPFGYHDLTVEGKFGRHRVLLICAPRRSYRLPKGHGEDSWGVFVPLYAHRSERTVGIGDFTDLENLTDWVGDQGGNVVATLPFLSAYLDEPFEPSPYAPVSRLFWNELYADFERAEGFATSARARRIAGSADFKREAAELRDLKLTDYRRVAALKRRVFEALADSFFECGGDAKNSDFVAFMRERTELKQYAKFRAYGERLRTPWQTWPAAQRAGRIGPKDYDERNYRYHLFVQWVADRQVAHLGAQAARQGPGLYLDLPVGVNGNSYDVWRDRKSFVSGVYTGAPPDPFFTGGQDWGFPPYHPEAIRERHYADFIAAIRHQCRHAGILRIDHVMGLHRLFWVPCEMGAREGLYVKYNSGEASAILALESTRNRTMIVGEDLGIVPEAVRKGMTSHGFKRMYVMQFGVNADPERAVQSIPNNAVASLNTHDVPPFASFWRSADVDDRVDLGLCREDRAHSEKADRERVKQALTSYLGSKGMIENGSPGRLARENVNGGGAAGLEAEAVLKGCLRYLASSHAPAVLVSLEDLWLEAAPQNVPGTVDERPNWRRKARFTFEQFAKDPEILGLLRDIDRRRSNGHT